jgi:hypothetical protein
MKKLIAMIPTEGRTEEEIASEMKKHLDEKGLTFESDEILPEPDAVGRKIHPFRNWFNGHKSQIKHILKKGALAIIVLWFVWVLSCETSESEKATKKFCKEQCNYDVGSETWFIDVGWIFEEEGLESNMETKKSFGAKNLDECIKYCDELGDHLKYLRDPGAYQIER